jgi:RimJ/RimL family protein N-acetyltransferase
MAEPGGLRVRHIESQRLYLVSSTIDLAEADLAGRARLAEALGVAVPDNWPPDLYDRPAVEYTRRQLEERAERGWSTWYLVSKPPNAQVLGICGFKGRPNSQGSVEISYSVLRQFRNTGLASEAVARLVAWAFTHQQVREVSAETMPHLMESIQVLEKNGFRRAGTGSERGVIRFAISRRSLD